MLGIFCVVLIIWCFVLQIHAVARKDYHRGDSAASDTTFRISDIPIVAFGSRAHLEEKALATVKFTNDTRCLTIFWFSCLSCTFLLVELVQSLFQRKWYRNFLMKGFHLVVLLTAGPGIRDTQVGSFIV